MEKQYGVFDTAGEAIEAAQKAQRELVMNFGKNDRERFIARIKKNVLDNLESLCKFEAEETKYGRYEDKLLKNAGIADVVGTELLTTRVFATEQGLTIEYQAPYGVIGGVTPVTNPVATVMSNGIVMMAGGNSVVFNAHPAAKGCSAAAVHLFNQSVMEEGGPCNIVTMVKNPTMDTLADIMSSPVVKLLVGTGGPAMVRTLLKSGKKVIAAGAGNPPTIVDETADIKKAAAGIWESASFDNGLLCIAEKEIFVVKDVYDEFISEMSKLNVRLLTRDEADAVTKVAIEKLENGNYAAVKKMVGQNAAKILNAAGIEENGDPKVCIFEATNDDLFVQTEQMMPILPIVKCENFEEALSRAVNAEHGNQHSASIWSQSIDNVTKYGKLINTTIFVQNGGTRAAFGIGGSGNSGPTIATPTGEGVCDANTFTRRRRFAMADGGNYIL